MTSAYVQSAIGIAIALALFLVGMAFGMVVNQWKAGVIGDAATWAGAALAGLAFGGTIFLARTDHWNKKKTERDLILIKSTAIQNALATLIDLIDTAIAELNRNTSSENAFQFVLQRLRKIVFWSDIDAIPFIAMQDNTAVNLMDMKGIVLVTTELLENRIANFHRLSDAEIKNHRARLLATLIFTTKKGSEVSEAINSFTDKHPDTSRYVG